jgi:hypothetical protein
MIHILRKERKDEEYFYLSNSSRNPADAVEAPSTHF